MELHDLFSLECEAWFKKDDKYYSAKQMQKIMREVLRVDPGHAQEFFDGFKPSKKPSPSFRS
ncbi:hypothetical protein [Candidatus Nitrososphaera sp. FF02]|uniref:hypothetical protein n=1 Tax=Candidatus Nitrososphaera sp. FF02 TaxID=3398226 RepID=UPI0039E8DE31